MYVKTYEHGRDRLLAACDKELIGRELKEGKICFEITESFYKDKIVDCDGLQQVIGRCTVFNLVGQKVIDCANQSLSINKDNILNIQGVPHIQIVRMLKGDMGGYIGR